MRFPNRMVIDGKERNLCRRKFCLECSPFGQHNTSSHPLRKRGRGVGIPYALWTDDEKKRSQKSVNKRKGAQRERAIRRLGGKCQLCGYDKYSGCLNFHHLNPKDKRFSLSKNNFGKKWETLRVEIDKCVLLCANCHGEVHAGLEEI